MVVHENKPFWKNKKKTLIIIAVIIVVVLLTIFTDIFNITEAISITQTVALAALLIILVTVVALLSRFYQLTDTASRSFEELEKLSACLEGVPELLNQINKNTRLSETAKVIAFREADRQSLREAVFDKLHQQDFDLTYAIIDEIANRPEYAELVKQLRAQADRYRDATDLERINQVVAHIEKLLDNYQWKQASSQIEKLIQTHPDSEGAKALRQKLVDKKEERKKILLTAWDGAIKRQATDRSLEILSDLDQYLTPNEALALQEAARDVFRNKLHNLGVQFSLAVSGKQWAAALNTGQQIINDFPNSKMAEEIREKIDVLIQNVNS